MRHIGGLDRRIFQKISSFALDRGGNFAVMFGLVATTLFLAVGFGVDTVQLINSKSALQGAVDAAVTSTARDLTTGVITEKDAPGVINAFLTANSTGGVLAYDGIVLDKLTIDRTAKTVEVTAHVDVDLFFPLFGMENTRPVSNTSAAVYSDKRIEVAMMLDVTGSMKKTNKKDKIGDLKTAAANAVDLLLPDSQDQNNPRVRVAIVPYAEAVNTGVLKNTVFVEKKNGPDLPEAEGNAILVSASSRPDNCATERKDKNGAADFSDDAPDSPRFDKKNKRYAAKVNRDDRLDICPEAALIPLTANKQKLLDTIDDFEADGVTAGGIAAQWGYYMLSPKWRTTIKSAGGGDGPADLNKNKIAKVAILMTDGQFNTAFAGVKESSDPKKQPQNYQGAKARSYAESICTNMKDDGIAVFTIGFDLSSSEKDEARGVLKDCASKDTSSVKHFYDVSTGPELDAAFKEIIANTERLALTR